MKIVDKIKSTMTPSHRAFFQKYFPLIVFLVPPLLILAIFMGYPVIYTIWRSFFDATGNFVGLDNYYRIITSARTLTALRNNALWVMIVPFIVTTLGLIYAILTEKISWSGLFLIILFIPLVVSGLAAGVTFRFMYAYNPDLGALNAASQAIVHMVRPPGLYPGARPSLPDQYTKTDDGHLLYEGEIEAGDMAYFPLGGISPQLVPDDASEVTVPEPIENGISGAVWLDFITGGGGTRGQPDSGKMGLPGARVDIAYNGEVQATTYTNEDGSFTFEDVSSNNFRIQLNASTFREPFGGFYWLGPNLVLPATMFAYIWISTGLALLLIKAGLSNIDRHLLEAGRIAGANEFQIFRHITIPLLKPILLVVFIRTVISVLKVFDIVLVVAPEASRGNATVLALEMWRVSFGGMRDFGLGSALATVLFLLILPVLLFNVRRFSFED